MLLSTFSSILLFFPAGWDILTDVVEMLKHADTILGKVINMSNLTQEEKPSAFAFTALVSNADDGFYRVIIFLSWLKSSILQIRAIIFNRSFSYLEELCTSIDRVQIRTVSWWVVGRVLLLLHPDSPALRSIFRVSFKRWGLMTPMGKFFYHTLQPNQLMRTSPLWSALARHQFHRSARAWPRQTWFLYETQVCQRRSCLQWIQWSPV